MNFILTACKDNSNNFDSKYIEDTVFVNRIKTEQKTTVTLLPEEKDEQKKRLDSLVVVFLENCQSFEDFSLIFEIKKRTDSIYYDLPVIFPVNPLRTKRISSLYGRRLHPIKHIFKNHSGIDLVGYLRDPVFGTANGLVLKATFEKGYGNYVLIEHKYGFQTLYAHLDEVNVQKGERIKRGQIIGRMGSTGQSTGVHLHYEIIKNNRKLKPLDFCTSMLK